MQTHLRKYVCSTGRKEASRSECYETLDVGWMRLGIECVTPALLEHRWRRGAILSPACHAECKISLPSPGMLVVQSSADTLRDSIKNDREDNNNEIANVLFILITSMVVITRCKFKRSSLSLSKVRRGLTRARLMLLDARNGSAEHRRNVSVTKLTPNPTFPVQKRSRPSLPPDTTPRRDRVIKTGSNVPRAVR
ncbi:hypothetical protein ALC53_10901 [Atta colombica]|uniref:Uncharacterized protein n=1 Tax=Atta colombica TaxID=520822 RepID=A0A151I0P1_9HYME|nr:hypothetical protein ALC53_10901 [Atta colombica]